MTKMTTAPNTTAPKVVHPTGPVDRIAPSRGDGCHCELAPGQIPDECVLDTGRILDCVRAIALSQDNVGKAGCNYWLPIARKS